jgi:hypothetical protein
MEVQDDGSLVIDALPMGVRFYALKGAPYRGHKNDVLWNDASTGKGLVVRCDGTVVRRAPTWKPGDPPIRIKAASLGMPGHSRKARSTHRRAGETRVFAD